MRHDGSRQGRLVVTLRRMQTLRRAMLADQPAGPAL